jgi:hypothetical protein
MRLAALISRKHVLLLLLVAVFFSVLPYAYTYVKLGYQAPKLLVGVYNNDSGYYSERMEEIKDGYPLLGNPYFIEHRSEIPPAFFLADWFGAIPLLLGASMLMTAVINFFVWSFLFLVLVYLLLRLLPVLPRWSLFGSIFVYMQVYLLMLRPVSMQVVFPFFLVFLISYILWLNDTKSRKKQIFLALAAAFTAYIYTYAWQVVIVALGLTPILFFFTGRKDSLKAFFTMFGIFVLASLPLVLYTMKQVAHPLYWETMQRIGLVNTHLPTAAAVYVSFWIFIMFFLWLLFSRYDPRVGLAKEQGMPFVFFTLLGTAMLVVTSSNVISGKDLELPQHIERFIILWFSLATVFTCYFFSRRQESRKFSSQALGAGVLLVAAVFFGNAMYFSILGPVTIFDDQYDFPLLRKIQEFDKPLTFLRENIKEPAVVWTDPQGPLNDYVTMMTQHYILFRAAGVLQLVSNSELEERYLISHYFALSEADLENDYWAYGGVGNAIHQWKTQNRKVKLCRVLRLDHLGYRCGELTDRVSWKGKEYFTDLYDKYENEVRPNILSGLKKYHVGYIIHDQETDPATFTPETLPGTTLLYSDGRFTIYRLEPAL